MKIARTKTISLVTAAAAVASPTLILLNPERQVMAPQNFLYLLRKKPALKEIPIVQLGPETDRLEGMCCIVESENVRPVLEWLRKETPTQ